MAKSPLTDMCINKINTNKQNAQDFIQFKVSKQHRQK